MDLNAAIIVMLISMTIAVSFFGCGLLVVRRSERRDQECFLALFLGLYALIKLDQLYLNTPGYEVFPHLAGIMFSAKLLLAPLIYFYARAVTSPNVHWLKARDAITLIAPIAAIIVAMPWYGLTAEQKIAMMDPATRDPELFERAKLGCQIGFVLFIITSLIYLTAAYRAFVEHTRRIRTLFSRIDDKNMDWLRWLLLILSIGWSTYGIAEFMAISGTLPEGAFEGILAFELLWISLIAFFGGRQRSVYRTLLPDKLMNAGQQEEVIDLIPQNSDTEPKQAYARSGLDKETRVAVAELLNQAIDRDRMYRKPELSLGDLAQRIQVSENGISETFSQFLNTNFFDFVNQFRVREACELLENTQDNVLDIAMQVGFNSRSTFNASFKKYVKQTPSEYRKSAQQPQSLAG